MTQRFRLPDGGAIDRSKPLAFTYDGARYEGCAGDTLASALLANGVHLVGRSFKYHRPRGIFSAGAEEPNALVQWERAGGTEPNARATTLELYEGLSASSQNCWPSVRHDIGVINNAMSRLLPAGFYYKTFMWPGSPRWWLRYEHWIRRAAGMGRAPHEADADHYEHQYAHCDVLVIGGGVAGLAAALAAANAGARVIVCDESARWGGSTVAIDARIDGASAHAWTRCAPSPTSRRDRTSRCSRARQPSAITTAIWSRPSSGSPIMSPWRRRFPRGSVGGRFAPDRSCSPAAPSNAALRTPTTDLPGTMLAGAAPHLRGAVCGMS